VKSSKREGGLPSPNENFMADIGRGGREGRREVIAYMVWGGFLINALLACAKVGCGNSVWMLVWARVWVDWRGETSILVD